MCSKWQQETTVIIGTTPDKGLVLLLPLLATVTWCNVNYPIKLTNWQMVLKAECTHTHTRFFPLLKCRGLLCAECAHPSSLFGLWKMCFLCTPKSSANRDHIRAETPAAKGHWMDGKVNLFQRIRSIVESPQCATGLRRNARCVERMQIWRFIYISWRGFFGCFVIG